MENKYHILNYNSIHQSYKVNMNLLCHLHLKKIQVIFHNWMRNLVAC